MKKGNDNREAAKKTKKRKKEHKKNSAVFVPEGTFLSGSLFLRDNTSLFLHKLAVLKGVADKNAYSLKGDDVNFNANAGSLQQRGFIWIDSVSSVSILELLHSKNRIRSNFPPNKPPTFPAILPILS
jgi:polygalacturonase